MTPFHAYFKARMLENQSDTDKIISAYASSNIEMYPYQIAAAEFALRSRHMKGCILCDEGSLGKTYEALLIATQKWCEGKDRILLILPINLINQWINKIENSFCLPYFLWNNETANGYEVPDNDGIIITTYDFAIRQAESIKKQIWDMVIFDEADVLFKPENKTVVTLRNAIDGAYKLLLTPTPITMSIMDIYGLIHFIDESVLPNAEDFYKRYFRKPENYPELTAWVSGFAFRTLKSQVTNYINFTDRLPVTIDYKLTAAEKILYTKVQSYLSISKKSAYPNMDNYELTLMFYHILSSSPKAFCKTLDGALSRTIGSEDSKERDLLEEIKNLSDGITENGKMKELSTILHSCFTHLKRLKISQKTIIFTNNLITLSLLTDLLEKKGYVVITNSCPDYINRFREEKTSVLIATDGAAKGLDIEFCPVVINYDFLFNAVEIEQRISRCHRQGQVSDVVVVNMLSKENLSDVRILELINKRVLQFSGIFGMSDPIVGNFGAAVNKVLNQLRKPREIEKAFEESLITNEDENKRIVENAEDTLFTTFTKSVADKVTVTPQYIEEQTAVIKSELWELVCEFFANRDDYEIDEQNQTMTLLTDTAPELVRYSTPTRNNCVHMGQKKYGLNKDFKPHSGRITLASPLVRGLLSAISCANRGTIVVNAEIESCEIGLYAVSISSGRNWIISYDVFVGSTETGAILTDDDCRKIMNLPVISYTDDGDLRANWLRGVTNLNPKHALDYGISKEKMIERYIAENGTTEAEEVERIKLRAMRQKVLLERSLDGLRVRIKAIKSEMANHSHDRMKELSLSKQLRELEKESKTKEQALFFDQMRIDVKTVEEIAVIEDKRKYDVQATQHFIVKIMGGNNV